MHNKLSHSERERLFELLMEYRDSVAKGEITGFHQSQDDELAEVATLLAKLKD